MAGYIEKLDSACKEYTEHSFVHASLLGVAGLLTIVAFMPAGV